MMPLIGLISLAMVYIKDKYLVLRVYRKPQYKINYCLIESLQWIFYIIGFIGFFGLFMYDRYIKGIWLSRYLHVQYLTNHIFEEDLHLPYLIL